MLEVLMVRDEEVGTSQMGGTTTRDSGPQADGDVHQVLSRIEGSTSTQNQASHDTTFGPGPDVVPRIRGAAPISPPSPAIESQF